MNKKYSTIIISLLLTGFTLPGFATCRYTEPATTKTGYYGAITPETYHNMQSAIILNKKKKMARLLSEGSIITIPAGLDVCINNTRYHLTQIKLPHRHFLYWVPDDALNMQKKPSTNVNELK